MKRETPVTKLHQYGFLHLGQSLKSLWKRSALVALALFGFEMLFVLLGSSARIQGDLMRGMKNTPEIAHKIMGEGFIEAVLKYGLIAIGYIHPFVFTLIILFSIMVFGQVVVSEIDSGTIGFTLSRPISRLRLFSNAIAVTIFGLFFLNLAMFLSSASGILVLHSGKLSVNPFISLVWNLFLVMLFAAAYVAIFASFSDSGKKFYTLTGVSLFFLYLVDMAGKIWKPLAVFTPINPFSYYEPMKLLIGGRLVFSQTVLILVLSTAMFTVAAVVFKHRDLPAG